MEEEVEAEGEEATAAIMSAAPAAPFSIYSAAVVKANKKECVIMCLSLECNEIV